MGRLPRCVSFFPNLGVARLIGPSLTIAQLYSGHDNPSKLCSAGEVKNVFTDGNVPDKIGPYSGFYMGCGLESLESFYLQAKLD